MAHARQSRPDSGLGFQTKVLKFPLRSAAKRVPSSLGSEEGATDLLGHGGKARCKSIRADGLIPALAQFRRSVSPYGVEYGSALRNVGSEVFRNKNKHVQQEGGDRFMDSKHLAAVVRSKPTSLQGYLAHKKPPPPSDHRNPHRRTSNEAPRPCIHPSDSQDVNAYPNGSRPPARFTQWTYKASLASGFVKGHT